MLRLTRKFLKDVLKSPNVAVGGGRLIFDLPSSEVAIDPGEKDQRQEFDLMVDDAEVFLAEKRQNKSKAGDLAKQPLGA